MSEFKYHEIIKGGRLKELSRACIYGWFRGTECLYIGRSINGMSRLCGNHKYLSSEHLRADDEIRIYRIKKNEKLDDLEKSLIQQLTPKYNVTHNGVLPIREQPKPFKCFWVNGGSPISGTAIPIIFKGSGVCSGMVRFLKHDDLSQEVEIYRSTLREWTPRNRTLIAEYRKLGKTIGSLNHRRDTIINKEMTDIQ